MSPEQNKIYETWDAFLAAWPLGRLRSMALPEYSAAGDTQTFTFWMESRLDEIGSIWGGSSFKFGIYSRRNKSERSSGGGASYSQDYGWYTKYGTTPEEAYAKVRSLVVEVAEAAANGDFRAIDPIDLGTAYKWKIAFHYQNRESPGVVAVFRKKWLQDWLKGRVGTVPDEMSELYRLTLSLAGGRDPVALSNAVCEEIAAQTPPGQVAKPDDLEIETPHDDLEPLTQPLNLVLYGPPGTGKTYITSEMAVRICDGFAPEGRGRLMERYRELRNLQRIRFVTFHPSFSYEEFVEGIRPTTTEAGEVRYDVRAGVFKQAVTHARELFEKREVPAPEVDLKGRRLFKMSLGDTSRADESWIFGDCVENDYVCLGFAAGIDFSGADDLAAVRERYLAATPGGKDSDYAILAVNYLKNEVKKGDLILVSAGNRRFRGLAKVTGPYEYESRAGGYEQTRPVRWLWSSAESLPSELIYAKNLSQMSIYLMNQSAVKWNALEELIAPKAAAGQAPNCVLVIDEVNRANLAKTFGELITLLESTKRLGGADEQETVLPYSGESFGLPPNLYVIGTMNTADRSIALMDTALRRRFAFREMPPRPELLEEDVAGVNLRALLTAMNSRIEDLFDRDHVLGHTYLMGISSFEDLVQRFQDQIIPLLQEYFFEDWRKIQRVFNDVEEPIERQIVQDAAVGDRSGILESGRRFGINPAISPAAIQKIYK